MIRKANKEDVLIINELGNYINSNFNKTYRIDSYINDSNYILLVNDNDNVNAFLLIYNNIDYYELEAIAVDEKYRKLHIADNMLKYFANNYLDKDIILEVAVDNVPAIKLYKKNGFKEIGMRKKYYNGIDAIIMKRVVK